MTVLKVYPKQRFQITDREVNFLADIQREQADTERVDCHSIGLGQPTSYKRIAAMRAGARESSEQTEAQPYEAKHCTLK